MELTGQALSLSCIAGGNGVYFKSAYVYPPDAADVIAVADGVEVRVPFNLNRGSDEDWFRNVDLDKLRIEKPGAEPRGLRESERIIFWGSGLKISSQIHQHYLLLSGVRFGEALEMLALKKLTAA